MSVDVTHLVEETLCHTSDHVFDDGADGTEAGDALAGSVVHLNVDDVFLGLCEGDGEVTKVALEFSFLDQLGS